MVRILKIFVRCLTFDVLIVYEHRVREEKWPAFISDKLLLMYIVLALCVLVAVVMRNCIAAIYCIVY